LAFRFLAANYGNQLQFTPDMKKIFVLSMLIPFAMICSCQKQDSAAERQLAQRKAELDAREKALDEREKALAEREKATASARTIPIPPNRPIPPDLQSRGQVRDPAQVKAERDRRLQQLPPDVQKLIPDPSRLQAEKDERDKRIQKRLGERQRRLEELQRMRMSPGVNPGASAFPGASASPGAVASPAAEATSPTPSPTPQ
jgi:hypothetical protein